MIIVVSFLTMKFMCCFSIPKSSHISIKGSHDLPKTPKSQVSRRSLFRKTYLNGCISKLSDYHTHDPRNFATDIVKPLLKSSYGHESFAFRGAKEWNNLNLVTNLVPSIHCFKSTLKATRLSNKG